MKRIKLQEQDLNISDDEYIDKLDAVVAAENKKIEINFQNDENYNSQADLINNEQGNDILNDVGNLNLSKECKELAEFEMLENCAQNSSFNSDSSVVQRVLRGESLEPQKLAQQESSVNDLETSDNSLQDKLRQEISNQDLTIPPETDCEKRLQEVQARKQELQHLLSDINPRIESLEKQISDSQQDNFELETKSAVDSDTRCSTPITDFDSIEANIAAVTLDDESRKNSLFESVIPENDTSTKTDFMDHLICPEMEASLVDECQKTAFENKSLPTHKSKIQEKLVELENEIKIYQELNAKLSAVQKERDEVVKKLQKEREDFKKYIEEKKNKLEFEMEEERRQIRRQKETFMRYQKLRQDHPTRKEREELSALLQKTEKLEEELKRQKIKYNNDCRRFKNQLMAAEKERDTFKLENIRLEDQCQDLLSALKVRNKKAKKEVSQKISVSTDKNSNSANTNAGNIHTSSVIPEKEVLPQNSEKKRSSILVEAKPRTAKPKVRFNLVPQYEGSVINGIENNSADEILHEVEASESSDGLENGIPEDCEDIEVEEPGYTEIKLGDRVERVYPSGEREIVFTSGTRKIVNANNEVVKVFFYNGDVKEILSDKREIYRFANGVSETCFPDGLEITEFPDGQIHTRYPDCSREVKYPDGTLHTIRLDGSEEMSYANGTIMTRESDGTEIVEFSNGQREIYTTQYKRREFPDGSVKIIYESGRQETRYSSGRIRIKDKDGKLIVDTKSLPGLKGQKSISVS